LPEFTASEVVDEAGIAFFSAGTEALPQPAKNDTDNNNPEITNNFCFFILVYFYPVKFGSRPTSKAGFNWG